MLTFLMGDPIATFSHAHAAPNCAPGTRVDYLAHYDMNHTTPERRAAFVKTVEARFSKW